jgi:hypothetical protein
MALVVVTKEYRRVDVTLICTNFFFLELSPPFLDLGLVHPVALVFQQKSQINFLC